MVGPGPRSEPNITCRIGRVSLPGGQHSFDTQDLQRQVHRELTRLLALDAVMSPLAHPAPSAGWPDPIHVERERIELVGPASTANVAHAIAHRLHRRLTEAREAAP